MTFLFFAIVVVLAMGGIALVASGRGAPMVDEHDDRPDALVPAEGDLGPQDLRRVRFTLGFRGYRMSEVDTLLSRLAAQLEAHQAWQPTAQASPTAQADPAVVLDKPTHEPAHEPTDVPTDLPTGDAQVARGPERHGDAVPPG